MRYLLLGVYGLILFLSICWALASSVQAQPPPVETDNPQGTVRATVVDPLDGNPHDLENSGFLYENSTNLTTDPTCANNTVNPDCTGAGTPVACCTGVGTGNCRLKMVDFDETSGAFDPVVCLGTTQIGRLFVETGTDRISAGETLFGTGLGTGEYRAIGRDDLPTPAEVVAATPGTCTVGRFYLKGPPYSLGDSVFLCIDAGGVYANIDTHFEEGEIEAQDLAENINLLPDQVIQFGSGGAKLAIPRQALNPTEIGQLLLHTGVNFIKYGDGTLTHTLVDEESAQSLSGAKTLLHPIFGTTAPGTTSGRGGYDPTLEKWMIGDPDGQVDFYPGRQRFTWSESWLFVQNTVPVYATLSGVTSGSTVAGARETLILHDMKCDRIAFQIISGASIAAGKLVTLVLRDDAVDTALSCSINGDAGDADCNFTTSDSSTLCCSDIEGTPVTFAAGSRVGWDAVCVTGCPTASIRWLAMATCWYEE